ncbi:MAG: low molecular weight phosphotyrosine protein phosphatase [Clostridiales bacterium]|nr:low molecular weight phosphotyrosine protein phosphatase [Clostridiales bacterium]
MRIVFVCHGNICRSPMAEFVMKELVRKSGREKEFQISSRAAHRDEIGSDAHPNTRRVLQSRGIPFSPRRATLLTAADADKYDLFIGMDAYNIRDMRRILGAGAEGKIHPLLSYIGETRDVADPWYTGDYETTYRDVAAGCAALLESLR